MQMYSQSLSESIRDPWHRGGPWAALAVKGGYRTPQGSPRQDGELSLIAQGHNRVEARGFHGGPEAEEEADGDRNNEPCHH